MLTIIITPQSINRILIERLHVMLTLGIQDSVVKKPDRDSTLMKLIII